VVQSLSAYILNCLLVAWNVLSYLNSASIPSEDEQRVLCLGITLHLCTKPQFHTPEDLPVTQIPRIILEQCKALGKQLNFFKFWANWHKHSAEIAYLAQSTHHRLDNDVGSANWANCKIANPFRLELLCCLFRFADIGVQLSDPADVTTTLRGEYLQKQLQFLGIPQKLVYHRSRSCVGLLTNDIHNHVMHFVRDLNWQPILFFPQGIAYLAPYDSEPPDPAGLQKFLWEQISDRLASSVLRGEVGFKRDGKGLKAAPQTLELLTPAQLIRNLPQVIQSYIKNEKDPATPKRLARLNLDPTEREFLADGADLRADRFAEFIILVQREFFSNCPEFVPWILEKLALQSDITASQVQVQSGGVNLGWYHAAARWVAQNSTLDFLERLHDLAEQLATWAEQNNLLSTHHNPTREVFYDYVTQYLEIQGWEVPESSFQTELTAYMNAKTKAARQPICSLSSGEFPSEDQMDSVVLFKPQQYSNKNLLGGRQIKRGISKIWSLEMLLRQAAWFAPAGKLEERQPVFLHVYPVSLHAPQLTAALQLLLEDLKHVNLWKIRKHWVKNGMDARALRSFPWVELPQTSEDTASEQDIHEDENAVSKQADLTCDLPFVLLTCTTTKEKTITDAWVKPIFLALTLTTFLGVKVAATNSSVPPYNKGSDFQEVVKFEGAADFWKLLQLPDSPDQVQNLLGVLNRLLVAYSLHLDIQSNPLDANWGALNGTVRDITTDILNIFLLVKKKIRRDNTKPEPTRKDIQQCWQYAQVWSKGNDLMEAKLKVAQQLASECRKFYQVNPYKPTHAILLPLSKMIEHILSVPEDWDDEEIINQGAGLLRTAINRQKIYKRPLLKDTAVDYDVRMLQHMEAIHTFTTTCVKQVFREMCKGDRALLQEQRNRIKAGVEFAYRQLAFQEKQDNANQKQGEARKCS
jgi:CRISPR-associated protein Csc3